MTNTTPTLPPASVTLAVIHAIQDAKALLAVTDAPLEFGVADARLQQAIDKLQSLLPADTSLRQGDIKVKFTPAVFYDYASRERFFELGINVADDDTPGTYLLTYDQAHDVLHDAESYCDSNGPASSLSLGERGAYRALRDQLRKTLETIDNQDASMHHI